MKKKIMSVICTVFAIVFVLSSLSVAAGAVTLARPKMTSVSGSCKSVTIKWSDSNKQKSGYLVYRRPDSKTGTWSRIAKISVPSTTSYTDKTVTAGKSYYYTVKTYYTYGKTTVTSKSTGDYLAKALPAKPVYTLISNCGTGVVMTWGARSDANGFAIYRSRTAEKGSWTRISTIKSGKAGKFTDTNVRIGETYYYCFKAYTTYKSKNYYSDISKIYCKVINAPTAPQNFTAVETADGVNISFDKVNATQGYSIYRSETGKAGEWIRLTKTTNNNTITYLDKGTQKGVKYYYTAKSFKTVSSVTTYSTTAKAAVITTSTEDHLLNTSFKKILQGGKFTLSFTQKGDFEGKDIDLDFTFVKDANKFMAEPAVSSLGLSIRLMSDGNKNYIVISSLRKYFETTKEMSVDDIYGQIGDTNGEFVSATNVEKDGKNYICEEYIQNGVTYKYYFDAKIKDIKFIEITSSFVETPEVITIKQLTTTVDSSVFTIPDNYVKDDSGLLETILSKFEDII